MTRTEKSAFLNTRPDLELVRLCAEGHEDAWDVLVRRYRTLMGVIPARAGLDRDAIEEVTQETFARLAERIESIQDGSRVRAWLTTTARRLTIDGIRARKASRRCLASEAELEHVPDRKELALQSLEKREARRLVHRALRRLDSRSRRLVSLLFFPQGGETPSYERISRELEMPTGSIGPTRARCLQKLRAEYQRAAAEPALQYAS